MKRRTYSQGFTLVEIIITIAIIGAMAVVIGVFERNIYYFKSIFEGSITQKDNARHILESVTNEIRSASPSSAGGYPLEEVNPQSFTFYADIDTDGIKERIRYFLSGTELKKGVIVPTGNPFLYLPVNEKITTIISGVHNGSNPVFEYYDTNYDGITAALASPVPVLSVRLVKITLQLYTATKGAPVQMTVTTQISIRNLKDNL